MATTNLNIKIDEDIKNESESIFNELGLNITAAINLFLKATIREHDIPFSLELDDPNEVTIAAMEEGDRLANDPSIPGYSNIEELKKALEV